VPGVGPAGHLAGGDVEGGEEGGGAVADVVVGAPLHLPGTHGQQRLGPVESLDLALLIDAEHHRLLRRMQVKADHVGDLLLQLGVGAELEAARAVGLEVMVLPGSEHRRPAHPDPAGDLAAGPVGLALGRPIQGDADDLGDHLLVVDPGTTPARGILLQAGHPGSLVAATPEQHRGNRALELLGDLPIGDAIGGPEDDLGAQDLAMRQGATAGPAGQGRVAVLVETQRGGGMIGHADIILVPPLSVKLFLCQCIGQVVVPRRHPPIASPDHPAGVGYRPRIV
jgi:hypothetical protein